MAAFFFRGGSCEDEIIWPIATHLSCVKDPSLNQIWEAENEWLPEYSDIKGGA